MISHAELAEILEAGWRAIPGKSAPGGEALAIALAAMSEKAREIDERWWPQEES